MCIEFSRYLYCSYILFIFDSIISRGGMIWFSSLSWCIGLVSMFTSESVHTFVRNGILGNVQWIWISPFIVFSEGRSPKFNRNGVLN